MPLTLTAANDDDGRRLDRILRKALPLLPLSAIHRLLRQGRVLVDGKRAEAACRIRTGQSIAVDSEDATFIDPAKDRGGAANAEKEKPEILFEGAGLLVINKPSGLAIHGKDSLEDRVLAYLKPKLPPSLSFRPGPLHRLDKPSSGVIVFSTNLQGARFFSTLMRVRRIKKFYLALLEGVIDKTEIWQDELIREKSQRKSFTGSSRNTAKAETLRLEHCGPAKTALTKVSPLAGNNTCTLVLAEIETGRTHQIRAQAAARGHPLMGDKKYGAGPFPPGDTAQHTGSSMKQNDSFLLHAWRLEFPPGSPLPPLIEAPLPDNFQKIINQLLDINISLYLSRINRLNPAKGGKRCSENS